MEKLIKVRQQQWRQLCPTPQSVTYAVCDSTRKYFKPFKLKLKNKNCNIKKESPLFPSIFHILSAFTSQADFI